MFLSVWLHRRSNMANMENHSHTVLIYAQLQLPSGFNYLWGIGLQFSVEQYHPKPNVSYSWENLSRSIKIRAWIEENSISYEEYFSTSLPGTLLLHQAK